MPLNSLHRALAVSYAATHTARAFAMDTCAHHLCEPATHAVITFCNKHVCVAHNVLINCVDNIMPSATLVEMIA